LQKNKLKTSEAVGGIYERERDSVSFCLKLNLFSIHDDQLDKRFAGSGEDGRVSILTQLSGVQSH